VTAASCGLVECGSPCHQPSTTGRYCAPTRCYCYGCPASPGPVERGRPATPAELAARQDQLRVELRDELRQAREAGDLAAALSGEAIAPPRIERRFWTASTSVVAA